jgi:hypothetical protein
LVGLFRAGGFGIPSKIERRPVKQALATALRDPVLSGSLALHRQGKLAKAILAYQEILQSDQNNADAAFLCGMAVL